MTSDFRKAERTAALESLRHQPSCAAVTEAPELCTCGAAFLAVLARPAGSSPPIRFFRGRRELQSERRPAALLDF